MWSELDEVLLWILNADSNDFKDRSNQGFFVTKRYFAGKDMGNLAYTILYLMLFNTETKGNAILQQRLTLLRSLKMKYPLLEYNRPQSRAQMSLMGDVVEVIVGWTRCTGVAFPKAIRVERNKLHREMFQFCDVLWYLRRSMFDDHDIDALDNCIAWPNALDLGCAIACLSKNRPTLHSDVPAIQNRFRNDCLADFFYHVMCLRASPYICFNISKHEDWFERWKKQQASTKGASKENAANVSIDEARQCHRCRILDA